MDIRVAKKARTSSAKVVMVVVMVPQPHNVLLYRRILDPHTSKKRDTPDKLHDMWIKITPIAMKLKANALHAVGEGEPKTFATADWSLCIMWPEGSAHSMPYMAEVKTLVRMKSALISKLCGK